MSSVAATRRSAAVGVVRELRRRNRPLFAVAAVNLGLAVVFTGLLAVDGRTLLGRNVWLKPWKFATSIAAFTATLAWLLPSLSLGDRRKRWVSRIVAAAVCHPEATRPPNHERSAASGSVWKGCGSYWVANSRISASLTS
jgi:hypothetical protein